MFFFNLRIIETPSYNNKFNYFKVTPFYFKHIFAKRSRQSTFSLDLVSIV